jgi:hypothetical protein
LRLASVSAALCGEINQKCFDQPGRCCRHAQHVGFGLTRGEDRIGAVSQLGREYLAREASPLQESQLIDTVQFSLCLLKTVIVAFMLQNGVMMLSISRIFQLHIRGV